MGLFEYDASPSVTESAQDHRILETLSQADWSRLLAHVERVKFRAGDFIITAGQIDRSIFILLEGRVSVIQDTPTGPRELAAYTEGSVIGEMAFFDGSPRSAHVRATTDGLAVRISRTKFDYLSAWEPTIASTLLFDLGAVLAQRLRDTTQELGRAKRT